MLASWLVFVVVAIIGLVAYPVLPDLMASHWGVSGEVNGYMSKTLSVIFLPALMFGLLLLFWFLPKIDPLKSNIDKFRKYYDSFVLVVQIFLGYVFSLTIVWNLGLKFDLFRFLIPALASLFYYLGVILPETRPNWIFGIRTPWTLASGRVWYKTHELGGKLFKFSAVMILGGFFWTNLAIYFILVPLLGSSVYLFLYSYREFKKEST